MNLHAPPPGEDRRGFFKQAAAVVLGAVTALVPLVAGLVTLLDPLRRKAGAAGFVHVTSLSALPKTAIRAGFTSSPTVRMRGTNFPRSLSARFISAGVGRKWMPSM